MMLLLCTITAVLSIMWVMYTKLSKNPLPTIPGPKGIPVLGNALQIDMKQPLEQLTQWAKVYGDIYKIKLATDTIVVINGFEVMWQALVENGRAFSGRIPQYRSQVLNENYSDTIMQDSTPQQKMQKKIVMNHIKAYDTGFKRIEEITNEVLNNSIEDLSNRASDKCIDLSDVIDDILMDTIYAITFGQKPQNESERSKIRQSVSLMNSVMTFVSSGIWLDMFPWLRYLGNSVWKDIQEYLKVRRQLYLEWKGLVKKNQKQGHDMTGNMLHTLLNIVKGKDNKFDLNEFNVDLTVWEMFGAGTTTTKAVIHSLFNILVHYPDVQARLHEECDRVIGREPGKIEDRKRMPYVQATIYEALRYVTPVPLMPHKCIEDSELSGHKIPGGTSLYLNFWGLSHDDAIWGDPFVFRPERYLDDNGDLVLADHVHRKCNLVFGAGPRVCAGETFAMSRMFLIIVRFLQNFNILPETTSEQQSSCDCRNMKLGAILYHPDYKVRLMARQASTH